jgi:hypothetical protein
MNTDSCVSVLESYADLKHVQFFQRFKYLPFIYVLIMPTSSFMSPYLCPVFNMRFEYTELL